MWAACFILWQPAEEASPPDGEQDKHQHYKQNSCNKQVEPAFADSCAAALILSRGLLRFIASGHRDFGHLEASSDDSYQPQILSNLHMRVS
jgi:hypothetical protein